MKISNGVKGFVKKLVPSQLLSSYHFILAFLASLVYGFPSQKIKVIGVTGTNGKTSVVEMITKILEEASFKVASLNSIKFKIGETVKSNTLRMTMPGRFFIQKFLKEALVRGCQYVVLEVTSEGIKQHRHRFINFEAAVFTNLTPEHIEAHGSFEHYRAEKGKLFQATKNIHVINIDDENAEYFLQFLAKEKYGYTMNSEQKTVSNKKLFIVHCSLFTSGPNGINFEVQNTKFNLKLLGEFNIYNALAAICVGLSQGISLETCKRALEKMEGLPGRMEEIISEPFKVFIDYAFTPVALEKVYQILSNQQLAINNKLICVLGAAGGGRDKWKRPVLGEIATKYCDEVIITNEDPYDEDPLEIIEQVASGIRNKELGITKILDRREAIRKALTLAKSGDTVIITGKGCEPCIIEKGKKIPWDDRQVAKEEFKKLFQK